MLSWQLDTLWHLYTKPCDWHYFPLPTSYNASYKVISYSIPLGAEGMGIHFIALALQWPFDCHAPLFVQFLRYNLPLARNWFHTYSNINRKFSVQKLAFILCRVKNNYIPIKIFGEFGPYRFGVDAICLKRQGESAPLLRYRMRLYSWRLQNKPSAVAEY